MLFPAHAGMEPLPQGRLGRLPCCSPHTRGWTVSKFPDRLDVLSVPRTRGDGPKLVGRFQNAVILFPAHAGMDRTWSTLTTKATPLFPAHAGMDRARRWSANDLNDLFPAHAGMDRAPPKRQRRYEWPVPRTRGDGPRQSRADTSPSELFPAHAGMDRSVNPACWRIPSVPRTRGDGPISKSSLLADSICSPHTRGWTDSRMGAGAEA